MYSGHTGLATGTTKCEYALIGGLCLNRKRAGRTASVRFEVAMQSAFHEKCSYTMAIPTAVWWRIGDGASDEGFNGCK